MPEQDSRMGGAPSPEGKSRGPVLVEINLSDDRIEWSGEAFLGTPLPAYGTTLEAWLQHIHPDDRAIVTDALSRASEQGVRHLEARHFNPKGDAIRVNFSYTLKSDPVSGARRALGSLEAADECQTVTHLRAERDRLATLNQELTEFANTASHDLQEPLRTITAFAELLADDCGESLSEAGREYLDFIHESTTRLQHLISDLLSYARLNSEGERFARVDLNKIINEVLQNLHQQLEETSPQIELSALPTIKGDRSRLVRLFQNLVSNALKFREPRKTPQLSISAVEEPDHWRIQVADNGIGIPPQQRDRIFDIFFRLHSQNTYPGSGIGLAVCAKIVALHGGKIWADANEAGGTTIHCTLSK